MTSAFLAFAGVSSSLESSLLELSLELSLESESSLASVSLDRVGETAFAFTFAGEGFGFSSMIAFKTWKV